MKRNLQCLVGSCIFMIATTLILIHFDVSGDVIALSAVLGLPLDFLMVHTFLNSIE